MGYRWYTKIPPGVNVLGRFGGCIWVCIVQACSSKLCHCYCTNNKQIATFKKIRKISANEIMVTINNEKANISEIANDFNFWPFYLHLLKALIH